MFCISYTMAVIINKNHTHRSNVSRVERNQNGALSEKGRESLCETICETVDRETLCWRRLLHFANLHNHIIEHGWINRTKLWKRSKKLFVITKFWWNFKNICRRGNDRKFCARCHNESKFSVMIGSS